MPSIPPDRTACGPATGHHRPRRPSLLADRYWCAHSWVEVLPDGTCFITPYDGGRTDTGTLAATTEAALATVAFRIDRQVPLVHTAAWTDPDRRIPALDERAPAGDGDSDRGSPDARDRDGRPAEREATSPEDD